MKSNKLFMVVLLLISALLSSCEAIADIFKAGVWVGVLIVVLVVGLIFWLISRAKK